MISDRVREASFQVLRLLAAKDQQLEEAVAAVRETLGLAPDEVRAVKLLLQGLLEQQEQLDHRLSALLRRFHWQEADPGEKTLLRLVAWEFWSFPDNWEECSVAAALALARALDPKGKSTLQVSILARHLAREIAFRVLYALDVGKSEPAPMLNYLSHLHGLDQERKKFAAGLVEGVVNNREQIDSRVKPFLQWDLHRLAAVDRTLLRIGTFEICYRSDAAPEVFINEAVELAKLYGNEDSAPFINAVLDKIAGAAGIKAGSRQ